MRIDKFIANLWYGSRKQVGEYIKNEYIAVNGETIYEKDYEKAVEITNPIVNSRNKSHVWCPKCGSYNVSAIYVSNKYGTAISLLCIFLVLIPGLYIVWANDFGLRSTIADYIVLSMFIFFLVIAFSGKISNANYMCKDCNKRFYHKWFFCSKVTEFQSKTQYMSLK